MTNGHSRPYFTTLRILSCFALLGSAAGAASAQTFTFPDPPDGTYEFTSSQSGPWHDPQTWGSKLGIPGTGDDVLIQDGDIVVVERQEPANHRFVRIEGELSFSPQDDTRLVAETLYVFGDGPGGENEGTFKIGTLLSPVMAGRTAEVVFTSSGAFDLSWDPNQVSRGLVSDGIVRLFGQPKTHVIPSPYPNLLAGRTVFALEPPWGGWEENDELVIAGTYFQRLESPAVTSSQDERVTITSHTGDYFQFEPALAYDHRSLGERRFHIVNLTRNVVLKSDAPLVVRDRGHVMFRNADVHIENVRFVDLGRTDKRIPLDDKVITLIGSPTSPSDYDITTPAPSQIQNRRGRYAVHFHRNGIQPQLVDPPSKVYGSVVDGAVGWGFVNHSSHVDFQRNVAYDFAGAGFATELGDELGNFFDNVAIRGTGNGEYRQDRVVFKNPERPQPLSDFGFSGDGFWFQGPALRVKNNIASGCDGAGMIWFTTGAPDVVVEYQDGLYTHNRYSHFPRGALDDVYGAGSGLLPRYWEHSDVDEKLVIADLPILELENFTAYGNLVGFKLRLNNHDSVDWYLENPFKYHQDLEVVCGGTITCAVRNRQTVDQLTLWNNEQAFRMRYVSNTDWLHVDAVNRLAYDSLAARDGRAGAEFRFRITSQTFTDLSIDGYAVAGWIQIDSADEARSEVTFFFPDPPAYANYVNRDSWIKGGDPLWISCGTPSPVQVTVISETTVDLTWQAGGNNSQYLLRYRQQGDPHWTFLPAPTESAMVSGLTAGVTYEVQVDAGCREPGGHESGVSPWSTKVSFITAECPLCQ